VYLCWQSHRNNRSDIYLKEWVDDQWSEPIAVTTHPASDWEPAIAIDPSNRLHIVYDTYRHGNYDVFLRTYYDGALSEEYPIAATENFEARATIACDDQGRAWITWDDQGPNWGLDAPQWSLEMTAGDWSPQPEYADGSHASKVSLRRWQNIRTAVFHNGNIWKPQTPVQEGLPLPLNISIEIPYFAVDAEGTPWLFFRRWIKKGGTGNFKDRPGGWDIYATSYNGAAWSTPVLLPECTGANDQRIAATTGPDGKLWVAYPGDDRLNATTLAIKAVQNRHGKVFCATFNTEYGAAPQLQSSALGTLRPDMRTASDDRRHTITSNGRQYSLYWGDLHRHTEISGDGGNDGTMWDMYRYAIDAAELDFIATTDHMYGGGWSSITNNNYEWWRTQKLADLFHVTGQFMPLFGYERSMKYPYGHRNVISPSRGATVVSQTVKGAQQNTNFERQPDEVSLWNDLRGKDFISIPHTSATSMGTDWAYNDPDLEPVVEIYQGCRLNYEGVGTPRSAPNGTPAYAKGFVWNALAKGYVLGFIASSDHRSTHQSYAAVYAESATREAIFRGMQVRHTFAATDNIVLDYRIGDAMMGDKINLTVAPELRVHVRGTAPIRQIDIIKNNGLIYSYSPGQRVVDMTYRDMFAVPGTSYYYVRVQQEDSEVAWASPIWVTYVPTGKSNVEPILLEQGNSVTPSNSGLHQNYPNPFNASTRIRFDLVRPGGVTLRIFNLLGRKVADFRESGLGAGSYVIHWDGHNLNGLPVESGVYVYHLKQEDGYEKTRKMLLLK